MQDQGPSAEDSNAHVWAREDRRGVQEDIFVKLERPSLTRAGRGHLSNAVLGSPPSPQKQKLCVCVTPARFPPDRPDTLEVASASALCLCLRLWGPSRLTDARLRSTMCVIVRVLFHTQHQTVFVRFIRCICGLLREKCRILVTHQLQHLQAADHIVLLQEVRQISTNGRFSRC